MYTLNGAICIKIQEKLIQKYQIWDHTGSIQKQPSAGIWKRILETRRILNIAKKRVMVKAVISSTISKEAVGRVLQKTDLKWTHFHRKEILTKNDLKLRLKFARKVCRKRIMCNYVIWNQSSECLCY